jgi:hypothetical protein
MENSNMTRMSGSSMVPKPAAAILRLSSAVIVRPEDEARIFSSISKIAAEGKPPGLVRSISTMPVLF